MLMMNLGAQLYSVRNLTQTPEDLAQTFRQIRKIGYKTVQLSGAAPMPAEFLRDISRETELPIVCSHMPFERITEDTDALIREHQVFGCPVIGLGSMPKCYRGTAEGLRAFLRVMETPVRKIREAGLAFAYHNHAFEFDPLTDTHGIAYDILIGLCADWQFIPDTYWIAYAGYSPEAYLRRIGGERIPNVHFKDMARDEARSICACGEGSLDFAAITAVCRELGVRNALVEQDNAPDSGDALGQMACSFRNLSGLFA